MEEVREYVLKEIMEDVEEAREEVVLWRGRRFSGEHVVTAVCSGGYIGRRLWRFVEEVQDAVVEVN